VAQWSRDAGSTPEKRTRRAGTLLMQLTFRCQLAFPSPGRALEAPSPSRAPPRHRCETAPGKVNGTAQYAIDVQVPGCTARSCARRLKAGGFSGNPGESDMLMRNSTTGAFEVYDISHNTITSAASMGQVGLEWTVAGVAADLPAGTSAASLEEWAPERVPLQWAGTQNNLSTALRTLGARESGTALLEEAVAACLAALEELTRERVPLQWAMTQNNLGLALASLGERERGTGVQPGLCGTWA
jgi:Tetratricopeptide repeat